MNKTISKQRVLAMAVLLVFLLVLYFVFLYRVSIIEGEKYYSASSELQQKEETVKRRLTKNCARMPTPKAMIGKSTV